METHAPGFNPDDEQWDAWADEADDPESYITNDNECSGCGYYFDAEELATRFIVEESGVSPGLHFGPNVYWATGYIVCPNCKDQLPYEVST